MYIHSCALHASIFHWSLALPPHIKHWHRLCTPLSGFKRTTVNNHASEIGFTNWIKMVKKLCGILKSYCTKLSFLSMTLRLQYYQVALKYCRNDLNWNWNREKGRKVVEHKLNAKMTVKKGDTLRKISKPFSLRAKVHKFVLQGKPHMGNRGRCKWKQIILI